MKKQHTIEETLKLLKINSRGALYNRINKCKQYLNMDEHMETKSDGKVYISAEGIEFIKNYKNLSDLDSLNCPKPDLDKDVLIDKLNNEIEALKNEISNRDILINKLNNEIEYVKKIVDNKDVQLSEHIRLIENSQILLKQNQIIMLENKEQKEKKSFWNMFK